MRHDDYLDADALAERERQRQQEHTARWERIERTAVALYAAWLSQPRPYREASKTDREIMIDEALFLINEIDRRRAEEGRGDE